MSRRRQNPTRRKPNQKRYKRRCQKRGRKARKGRQTNQRKKCLRRRGGKSTRKKRSSKKRGKRKWKGKNRRGARNWFGSRGLRPLSLGPRLGITNISYSGMAKIFVRQRQGQRHWERLSKVVTLWRDWLFPTNCWFYQFFGKFGSPWTIASEGKSEGGRLNWNVHNLIMILHPCTGRADYWQAHLDSMNRNCLQELATPVWL